MNTITSPVVAASERHSTSPLPGSGGRCGTTSVRRTTRAPGRGRDLDRAVGRPRVDDHQLVHQRGVAAGQRDDRGDDRADRRLLVQRGQDDRHPPPGLRGDEAGRASRRAPGRSGRRTTSR